MVQALAHCFPLLGCAIHHSPSAQFEYPIFISFRFKLKHVNGIKRTPIKMCAVTYLPQSDTFYQLNKLCVEYYFLWCVVSLWTFMKNSLHNVALCPLRVPIFLVPIISFLGTRCIIFWKKTFWHFLLWSCKKIENPPRSACQLSPILRENHTIAPP